MLKNILKNKKNRDFSQFNNLVPQILIELGRYKPSAIPVYMALVSLSNNLGCSIVPQSKIARQIHKSTRTVARLLNYLASNHYIGVARSGRANVYILNYNLIWKNYSYKKATMKKYIKFPANVVITQEQNPEFFKNFKKFIKRYGHKHIDLDSLKPKTVKPNKNPNRNKYRKARMAKDKQAKLRGWTTNKAEAKRLHIAYQTRIAFPKSKQNKKSVKN